MSDNWRGNAALEDFLVEIDEIERNPDNPRIHTERDISATALSLSEHGQQDIVVCRPDGVLLSGEGRWLAAKSLGWTRLAAVATDITDDGQQRFYSIRDNRTAELSRWDIEKLSKTLQRLKDEVDLAATNLWEPYELDPLLESDWSGNAERGQPLMVTVDQWTVLERAINRYYEISKAVDLGPGHAISGICRAYVEGPDQ